MTTVEMDPRTYVKFPIRPPPRNQALSSSTFSLPPLDGSLAVHEMCDWHYEHSPEHPVFQYADDAGNVTTIIMSQVVPAIHRAARFVRSALEVHTPNASKKPVIGILAASDSITSATLLMGVLRAGYVLFPISPRNSPVAVAHLLSKTAVDLLIIGPEHNHQHLAQEAFKLLTEKSDVVPQSATMPVFGDLYRDDANWERLPPYHPDPNEIATYMHSSGSTAYPKPIPWSYMRQVLIAISPFFGERDWTGTRLAIHSLPMYHGMGIIMAMWAITVGVVLTTFPPQSPARTATPDNLLKAVTDTKSQLVFCVPSFVETWAKNPDQVRELRKTQGVMYGGGPLLKEVGDELYAQGINIFTLYGCTEVGVLNPSLPKTGSKDWEYFNFPKNVHAHLLPHDNGNVELVVVTSQYGMVAVLNTEVDGVPAYNTHDLLAPHPTKPGYWKVFGRSDDQIMHSTGEKTNPGPLEQILNQDPHVQSSVMFGRGRFNAGLLIDPKPEYHFDPSDTAKLAAFRNKIWPTIEQMNQYAPQHSRIFKEMITVALPSKPFMYTAKNTPRRLAIIKEYEAEIDALYDAVDESTQADLAPPPVWTYASAKDFVRAAVTRVLEHPISDSDDLFQNGCDSLQATWIRNSVLHALRDTTKINTRTIPGNFVYRNSTIAGLAAFVSGLASSDYPDKMSEKEDAIAAMLQMVEKYSVSFPKHVPSAEAPSKEVVLVTGTTGGLGASLLVSLVRSSDVARVYAVNRKGSVPLSERQKDVLDERGFDGQAIVNSSKVVLLETKTEDDRLGLPADLYEEIRSTLTLIIHNAWPVNFNISLSSFEPSVKGVRNFIDLTLSSPHSVPPKLLFISSIGVIRHIDRSKPIKEAPVEPSVAVGTGYSESKWVVEKLLATASSRTPLRAAAIRLGQITGTSAGAWNKAEWMPSMVKSSLYLGCIPSLDKTVAWIPVDVAAEAVFEMRNSDVRYFHLAHPRPVAWKSVMEPLARALGLRMVPYDEWLASLAQSGEGHGADSEVEMMRQNPALKIIDFFREAKVGASPEAMGIPPLDVSQAEKAAPSLGPQGLPQLSERDASKWVAYWKRIRFL